MMWPAEKKLVCVSKYASALKVIFSGRDNDLSELLDQMYEEKVKTHNLFHSTHRLLTIFNKQTRAFEHTSSLLATDAMDTFNETLAVSALGGLTAGAVAAVAMNDEDRPWWIDTVSDDDALNPLNLGFELYEDASGIVAAATSGLLVAPIINQVPRVAADSERVFCATALIAFMLAMCDLEATKQHFEYVSRLEGGFDALFPTDVVTQLDAIFDTIRLPVSQRPASVLLPFRLGGWNILRTRTFGQVRYVTENEIVFARV